jgi:linoleoyl-CoA desaturase
VGHGGKDPAPPPFPVSGRAVDAHTRHRCRPPPAVGLGPLLRLTDGPADREGQTDAVAHRSDSSPSVLAGAEAPTHRESLGRGRHFGRDLRDAVDGRLDRVTLRRAHRQVQRKALIIGGWYLVSYLLVVFAASWPMGILACTSLALAMAGVGFNIQHDANHNALFDTGRSKRLSPANRMAGWSMYALGGSSRRWIAGHVHVHHSATNVVGKDDDIELAPFGRLAPQQRHRPWHRFQHLYLWALYCATAVAIMGSDIKSIVAESLRGDPADRRGRRREYLQLGLTKAAFAFAMLGVPLLFHPWWVVALGATFTLSITGLLLGVVFQMAHAVEEAEFRRAGDRGDVRWHEWQVRSTVDFCHGDGAVARMLTWYIGGLNFQTEHHLFPQVPHTAYPVIAPVVREVCRDFGVPHRVQPNLRRAVASHYRHLRRLSVA